MQADVRIDEDVYSPVVLRHHVHSYKEVLEKPDRLIQTSDLSVVSLPAVLVSSTNTYVV